jgi:hypothetical protein
MTNTTAPAPLSTIEIFDVATNGLVAVGLVSDVLIEGPLATVWLDDRDCGVVLDRSVRWQTTAS